MRLSFCPLCRGLPALKPCHGFCLNVMKGCLASITEMDGEWGRFLGEHAGQREANFEMGAVKLLLNGKLM